MKISDDLQIDDSFADDFILLESKAQQENGEESLIIDCDEYLPVVRVLIRAHLTKRAADLRRFTRWIVNKVSGASR